MGSGASGTASGINIQFDEVEPFQAGQHVTGTVAFYNKFEKEVKLQRIYAEFVGEVVYTTKQYNGSGYRNVTHHEPFFQQLISLQEQQGGFVLDSNYYSWPIAFSLPAFLPPSLDQLTTHGPFIRYKIRVVFERPEKYKMNIRRNFPIIVIARRSSSLGLSVLPVEEENKNHSNVTLHALLAGQGGPITPGGTFLLDIELQNPNQVSIKRLSIDLVQHRVISMGGHCALNIPLLDLSDLREFSGKHYHETLELAVPAEYPIIPSFYYMPPTAAGRPIAVEYKLKLEAKVHGFFKNFTVNIPITIHSKQPYMEAPNEEEAPPPPYDFVLTI